MTARDVLAEIEQRTESALRPGTSVYRALDKTVIDNRTLVAALRAVLDLHPRVQDVDARDEPGERYYAIDGWWCGNPNCGIGTVRYPCDTVRSITDALNGVTAGTGR